MRFYGTYEKLGHYRQNATFSVILILIWGKVRRLYDPMDRSYNVTRKFCDLLNLLGFENFTKIWIDFVII